MSVALEDTVSIHHDHLLFLEENLEVMIGVVQTLKGRVGSALNIGEKYVAPTLWGATAFIAEEVSNMVEPVRASVETLVASDLVHTAKIATSKRWTVKILLERVTDMNNALKDIRADMILVRAEQGVGLYSSDGQR